MRETTLRRRSRGGRRRLTTACLRQPGCAGSDSSGFQSLRIPGKGEYPATPWNFGGAMKPFQQLSSWKASWIKTKLLPLCCLAGQCQKGTECCRSCHTKIDKLPPEHFDHKSLPASSMSVGLVWSLSNFRSRSLSKCFLDNPRISCLVCVCGFWSNISMKRKFDHVN